MNPYRDKSVLLYLHTHAHTHTFTLGDKSFSFPLFFITSVESSTAAAVVDKFLNSH